LELGLTPGLPQVFQKLGTRSDPNGTRITQSNVAQQLAMQPIK
jgi:hypothetical protein